MKKNGDRLKWTDFFGVMTKVPSEKSLLRHSSFKNLALDGAIRLGLCGLFYFGISFFCYFDYNVFVRSVILVGSSNLKSAMD